jgi:hypothetical protein
MVCLADKKLKWRKLGYSGESEIPFTPTEKQLDRKHNGLFKNSRDYLATVVLHELKIARANFSIFK